MSSNTINLNTNGTPHPRSIKQRLHDAKSQPVIEPLIGDFWFVGELHILFADTGIGKSILATQIADALTKGIPLLGLRTPDHSLRVLMLDFELSDRQLEARYTDKETFTVFEFADTFLSDGIDFIELGNNYPDIRLDQAILFRIRDFIHSTQAEVLIIDNISYLSMQSAQDTQVAMELMKSLVDLKRELSISILVLAHTPKIPLARPISINDLAGSKHLANFADSVSGLGRSCTGADIVYWKQTKASRSGEFVYDGDNVITLRRTRILSNFVGFEKIGTTSEYKHLKLNDPEERMRLRAQAIELHSRGISLTEIAQKVLGDKNKKSTIWNWVKGEQSKFATVQTQIPYPNDEQKDNVDSMNEACAVNALNNLNHSCTLLKFIPSTTH